MTPREKKTKDFRKHGHTTGLTKGQRAVIAKYRKTEMVLGNELEREVRATGLTFAAFSKHLRSERFISRDDDIRLPGEKKGASRG